MMVPCCLAGDFLELRFLSVALLLADASEPSWLEFEESGNRKTHSMVLIVMTIGSVFNRVQGTLMWSSWMCPDTKVKGRPSSFSRTSSLKSKLEKTTSPPQRLTCNQDFFKCLANFTKFEKLCTASQTKSNGALCPFKFEFRNLTVLSFDRKFTKGQSLPEIDRLGHFSHTYPHN